MRAEVMSRMFVYLIRADQALIANGAQPTAFCDNFYKTGLTTTYSLREAWEVCDRPAFMLWWLVHFCCVDNLCEWGNDQWGRREWTFTGDKVDRERCDLIRANWTYWGERITPRGRVIA